jgi:hypothetical protein
MSASEKGVFIRTEADFAEFAKSCGYTDLDKFAFLCCATFEWCKDKWVKMGPDMVEVSNKNEEAVMKSWRVECSSIGSEEYAQGWFVKTETAEEAKAAVQRQSEYRSEYSELEAIELSEAEVEEMIEEVGYFSDVNGKEVQEVEQGVAYYYDDNESEGTWLDQ